MSDSHGGRYVVSDKGDVEEVEGPRRTARELAEKARAVKPKPAVNQPVIKTSPTAKG